MRNNECKVLPINDNPSMRMCIHYAYPCAIIESKELAILQVDNYCDESWDTITNDTTIEMNGDVITISKAESGENTNTILWRNCKSKDEVIVKVDYVKLMDCARYLDVFLFNNDLNTQIELEDKTCGIRWNSYGYFIGKTMYNYDTKRYKYIKLCVEDESIHCYASMNGVDWEAAGKKDFSDILAKKNLKIGIHVYSGRDSYDIWKKMNFIQLIYNEIDPYKGIWLDYYFCPRKNYDNSFQYYSNFLDVNYEVLYDVLDCFSDIHEYLHWSIRHNYYVEMCLNEYYIENRYVYQKNNYPHYNLFYGFDDAKREYYIMGYGIYNIPVVSTISYDIVNEQLIESEKIIRYQYRASEVTALKFNINAVILGLYEFVNNVNSSDKVSNLITEENVTFGISTLKRLIETEKGKNVLMYDRRVAFMFKEYSSLMEERIDYLYKMDYIAKEKYMECKELCKENNKRSNIILALVIKNMRKPVKEEKVCSKVEQLYDNLKLLCETLLESLLENEKTSKIISIQ